MTDLAIEMNVPIAQFKAGMRQPGAASPAPSPSPSPSPSPAPSSTPGVGPRGLADYAVSSGLIRRAMGGEVTSPWASDLSQVSEGWQAAQDPLENKFAKMDNKEFIQNSEASMMGGAKKDYTDLMGGSPNAMAASGMNSFIKSYG